MPNSHGEKIQTPVKAGRTSAKATALLSSPKSSSTTTPKRTHHKKLILTFWISVTAEGDSCIHAAQIGGHVSAARCFLEDLTTLGELHECNLTHNTSCRSLRRCLLVQRTIDGGSGLRSGGFYYLSIDL